MINSGIDQTCHIDHEKCIPDEFGIVTHGWRMQGAVESTELSDKSIETLDESIEPLEKSIELLVESTELLLVGSWATDNEAFLLLHGRATVTHPDDDDDVRTARASAHA